MKRCCIISISQPQGESTDLFIFEDRIADPERDRLVDQD